MPAGQKQAPARRGRGDGCASGFWHFRCAPVILGAFIPSRRCPSDELPIRIETPLQRLLVERALAFAKELEQAADAAPDGLVLDRCESVAVASGRDFLRGALADTRESQAAVADGKRGPRGPAPAAAGGGTRAARRDRS